MDANGGIQKVRVDPATRSVVATCYTPGRGKIAETPIGGGVLSAFVFPVDCHCSFAVVTSRMWQCAS